MARGRLKPEHEKCIQTLYDYLKSNIDASLIVDFLFQKEVIGMEDKECIIAEKQKSKRNDLLLTAILKAGPGEAFAVFLDALKPNHINVWKTIDDKLTSDSRKLFKTTSGDKQDLKQRKIKSNVNLSEITVLLFGINESDAEYVTKAIMKGKPMKSISGVLLGTTYFSERELTIVKSPQMENHTKSFVKIIEEVKLLIEAESKGYHAFLLVVRYAELMTHTILKMMETLKLMFGSNVLKKYIVLLLTHGGEIDMEKICIDEWLSRQGKDVKKIFKECGKRAVIFNTNTDSCEPQKDPIKSIARVIDNLQFHGRRYTLNEFKEAEIGRRTLLVQENKLKITDETMNKCKCLLQSSNEIITNDSQENVEKMSLLITQAQNLWKQIFEEDAGTNVLKEAMYTVDNIITQLESQHSNLIKIERNRDKHENSRHKNNVHQKFENLNRYQLDTSCLQEEIHYKKNENQRLQKKLNEILEQNQKLLEETDKNVKEEENEKKELQTLKQKHSSLLDIKRAEERKLFLISLLPFILIISYILLGLFWIQNEDTKSSTWINVSETNLHSRNRWAKHYKELNVPNVKHSTVYKALTQSWLAFRSRNIDLRIQITLLETEVNLTQKEMKKVKIQNVNLQRKIKLIPTVCDIELKSQTIRWLWEQEVKENTSETLKALKKKFRNEKEKINQNIANLRSNNTKIKVDCDKTSQRLSQELESIESGYEKRKLNLTALVSMNKITKDRIEMIKDNSQNLLANCKSAMSQCQAYA